MDSLDIADINNAFSELHVYRLFKNYGADINSVKEESDLELIAQIEQMRKIADGND